MSGMRGLVLAMLVQACTGAAQAPAPVASSVPVPTASVASDDVQQLVVVTTPANSKPAAAKNEAFRWEFSFTRGSNVKPAKISVKSEGSQRGADRRLPPSAAAAFGLTP